MCLHSQFRWAYNTVSALCLPWTRSLVSGTHDLEALVLGIRDLESLVWELMTLKLSKLGNS